MLRHTGLLELNGIRMIYNIIKRLNISSYTNYMNSISVNDLESLCTVVELMDLFHQKEILKILSGHTERVTLNENKNGVLVNLTDVPDDIIKEINDYIIHVNKQEKELGCDEAIKEQLKTEYF